MKMLIKILWFLFPLGVMWLLAFFQCISGFDFGIDVNWYGFTYFYIIIGSILLSITKLVK